jgi:hypothetical protein
MNGDDGLALVALDNHMRAALSQLTTTATAKDLEYFLSGHAFWIIGLLTPIRQVA